MGLREWWERLLFMLGLSDYHPDLGYLSQEEALRIITKALKEQHEEKR